MTTDKAASDLAGLQSRVAGLQSRVGRRLTGLGLATGGCLVNASATTWDHKSVSTCV